MKPSPTEPSPTTAPTPAPKTATTAVTPRLSATLVVDLAFGDAGKGSIVDYLARTGGAELIVRFNGGPQAGHNVVTPDGRHHTFAQFSSGTFLPGVQTLLSRFMLIEPYALFNEAAHLRHAGVHDALDRLLIDARCPIITPAHQVANRLRELARGEQAHGTCGMGVGETMGDLLANPDATIRARELGDRAAVIAKLNAVCDLKIEQLRGDIAALSKHPRAAPLIQTLFDRAWIDIAADNYEELARQGKIVDDTHILKSAGSVIFEGAQGVLLDESFGFHPYTTWSTTTFANADALLDEANFPGDRTRVGVLRTYFTRHGPGPLVTEDPSLAASLSELHNDDAGWQGRFRVGVFDAAAARYALDVAGGVDWIALTHVDRLPQLPRRMCVSYEGAELVRLPAEDLPAREILTRAIARCRPTYEQWRGDDLERSFIEAVESHLPARIGLISDGPTAQDKRIVRA
jgi:adenylosuccinate synthase